MVRASCKLLQLVVLESSTRMYEYETSYYYRYVHRKAKSKNAERKRYTPKHKKRK